MPAASAHHGQLRLATSAPHPFAPARSRRPRRLDRPTSARAYLKGRWVREASCQLRGYLTAHAACSPRRWPGQLPAGRGVSPVWQHLRPHRRQLAVSRRPDRRPRTADRLAGPRAGAPTGQVGHRGRVGPAAGWRRSHGGFGSDYGQTLPGPDKRRPAAHCAAYGRSARNAVVMKCRIRGRFGWRESAGGSGAVRYRCHGSAGEAPRWRSDAGIRREVAQGRMPARLAADPAGLAHPRPMLASSRPRPRAEHLDSAQTAPPRPDRGKSTGDA